MRFEFIDVHKKLWPIRVMCKCLRVRPSGFFRWRKSKLNPAKKAETVLELLILSIFNEHKRRYGSPRVHQELIKRNGMPVSKSKVSRIMKKMGLRARGKRKFRITTDSSHKFSRSPNLLERIQEVNSLNTVWASDITYIWTHEGWMYLCVILDLYSRKVVGWSLQNHLKATLVLEALRMAAGRRNPDPGLIFHSDQGIQYACDAFRAVLSKYGFIQSMSHKGNCYDNATVESFFHSLKVEEIHDYTFVTREELRSRVFSWIEKYYNRKRLHSALGYNSPVEFEELEKVA